MPTDQIQFGKKENKQMKKDQKGNFYILKISNIQGIRMLKERLDQKISGNDSKSEKKVEYYA